MPRDPSNDDGRNDDDIHLYIWRGSFPLFVQKPYGARPLPSLHFPLFIDDGRTRFHRAPVSRMRPSAEGRAMMIITILCIGATRRRSPSSTNRPSEEWGNILWCANQMRFMWHICFILLRPAYCRLDIRKTLLGWFKKRAAAQRARIFSSFSAGWLPLCRASLAMALCAPRRHFVLCDKSKTGVRDIAGPTFNLCNEYGKWFFSWILYANRMENIFIINYFWINKLYLFALFV